jgi:hypothetical protein
MLEMLAGGMLGDSWEACGVAVGMLGGCWELLRRLLWNGCKAIGGWW